MSEEERELARVKRADIALEDHGFLFFDGRFVSDHGSQGLGVGVDGPFIKALMQVFGVERLRQIEGKPCWVTRRKGQIRLIEPLFPNEGTPLDLDVWANSR